MSNREAQVQPVSPSMQMMQILWLGAMAGALARTELDKLR